VPLVDAAHAIGECVPANSLAVRCLTLTPRFGSLILLLWLILQVRLTPVLHYLMLISLKKTTATTYFYKGNIPFDLICNVLLKKKFLG